MMSTESAAESATPLLQQPPAATLDCESDPVERDILPHTSNLYAHGPAFKIKLVQDSPDLQAFVELLKALGSLDHVEAKRQIAFIENISRDDFRAAAPSLYQLVNIESVFYSMRYLRHDGPSSAPVSTSTAQQLALQYHIVCSNLMAIATRVDDMWKQMPARESAHAEIQFLAIIGELVAACRLRFSQVDCLALIQRDWVDVSMVTLQQRIYEDKIAFHGDNAFRALPWYTRVLWLEMYTVSCLLDANIFCGTNMYQMSATALQKAHTSLRVLAECCGKARVNEPTAATATATAATTAGIDLMDSAHDGHIAQRSTSSVGRAESLRLSQHFMHRPGSPAPSLRYASTSISNNNNTATGIPSSVAAMSGTPQLSRLSQLFPESPLPAIPASPQISMLTAVDSTASLTSLQSPATPLISQFGNPLIQSPLIVPPSPSASTSTSTSAAMQHGPKPASTTARVATTVSRAVSGIFKIGGTSSASRSTGSKSATAVDQHNAKPHKVLRGLPPFTVWLNYWSDSITAKMSIVFSRHLLAGEAMFHRSIARSALWGQPGALLGLSGDKTLWDHYSDMLSIPGVCYVAFVARLFVNDRGVMEDQFAPDGDFATRMQDIPLTGRERYRFFNVLTPGLIKDHNALRKAFISRTQSTVGSSDDGDRNGAGNVIGEEDIAVFMEMLEDVGIVTTIPSRLMGPTKGSKIYHKATNVPTFAKTLPQQRGISTTGNDKTRPLFVRQTGNALREKLIDNVLRTMQVSARTISDDLNNANALSPADLTNDTNGSTEPLLLPLKCAAHVPLDQEAVQNADVEQWYVNRWLRNARLIGRGGDGKVELICLEDVWSMPPHVRKGIEKRIEERCRHDDSLKQQYLKLVSRMFGSPAHSQQKPSQHRTTPVEKRPIYYRQRQVHVRTPKAKRTLFISVVDTQPHVISIVAAIDDAKLEDEYMAAVEDHKNKQQLQQQLRQQQQQQQQRRYGSNTSTLRNIQSVSTTSISSASTSSSLPDIPSIDISELSNAARRTMSDKLETITRALRHADIYELLRHPEVIERAVLNQATSAATALTSAATAAAAVAPAPANTISNGTPMSATASYASKLP
ncbi:hypothetical protein GQ42DRAFT_178498 [Ramicandelaber brevisporus]|nr:hypothetical protein GQ42DRAFT_178498 [Ramicandelaber brevisporus]